MASPWAAASSCMARLVAARPIWPALPPGEVKGGLLVGRQLATCLTCGSGRASGNLHEIFEQARGHKPCVLFFDEVGCSRGEPERHAAQAAADSSSISFFAEPGRLPVGPTKGVLILGGHQCSVATWIRRFRRPGRLRPKLSSFPRPTQPGTRGPSYASLCKDKPVETLDFDQVAKKTEELFRRADLKAVLDVANRSEVARGHEGLDRRNRSRRRNLLAAAGTVRPSTKEWFATGPQTTRFTQTKAGSTTTFSSILKLV